MDAHLPNNPNLSDWIILHLAPGLGPATVQALLAELGSAHAILAAPRSRLQHYRLSDDCIDSIKQPNSAAVDATLAWAQGAQQHLICWDDVRYPERLRSISTPPCLLYVQGDANLLNEPQLAMVGSRHASRGGLETATAFARDLSQRGLIITSGLAAGIDGAAHEGALAASAPTIAVMATGIDLIYPKQHQALAARIIQRGALVTEMPLGTAPKPYHFPQRNRIISGLSLGTLVVEAAAQSGSLITAHHAMEQGREVFAIPGSIHNPTAKGCHHLIRQGAKLIETSQQILEELAPHIKSYLQPATKPATDNHSTSALPADHQQVLDNLGFDPIDFDSLLARSSLNTQELSSVLLILELQGLVETLPGGRFSRLA
ncbi:MAG: DNA-protecting protein DprA [Gammaproteobacteria bacterium]|nr:DNA-protecting protein DprA [Gammaproteobacteria bacterium]